MSAPDDLRDAMHSVTLSRPGVPDWVCHHGVIGPEDAPRVLLVMGFGMPGVIWTPLIQHLQHTHRLCWYDHRGIGSSSGGELPFTLSDLSADAIALMDHLDWPEAHIAGISMGGMIAQHLGLDHRDRVRSLTLMATTPGSWLAYPPPPAGILGFVRANAARGPARLQALVRLLLPPERVPDRPDALHPLLLDALSRPAPKSVRLQQLRAVMAHDTRARLPALAGLPTLVVRPGRDLLVPPRANDALADAIPGAQRLDLPDTGHGVLALDAAPVAEAMRTFLGDLG